ncbi:hypothetical protein J3F84DRAFT_372797 [Trichoderma pleuroticola]
MAHFSAHVPQLVTAVSMFVTRHSRYGTSDTTSNHHLAIFALILSANPARDLKTPQAGGSPATVPGPRPAHQISSPIHSCLEPGQPMSIPRCRFDQHQSLCCNLATLPPNYRQPITSSYQPK